MSARAKRVSPDRALAVTKWRDALNPVGVQQSLWALRRRLKLAVTVSRISPDVAEVKALVTGGAARPEGVPMRWRITASNAPVDAEKIAAQVAEACRWCEMEADRLALGGAR